MNIAPVSPVSVLDPAASAEALRAEIEVALLQKEQELAQARGSAIVALIEAAVAPTGESPSQPGFDETA